MLHKGSKISDYAEWLDRPDLQLDTELIDFHAHIIGDTPEAVTAIVWLKDDAPAETHTTEHERFLILEGACDITITGTTHSLKPGDALFIPLHASHHVTVTSPYPCKIILQRAAA